MTQALNYAINLLVSGTIWYFMACSVFWGSERVNRKYIVLVCLALLALRVTGGYFIVSSFYDWGAWDDIFLIVHTVLLNIAFFACFKIKFVKLLYSMLLIFNLSTFINFLAHISVLLIWPDTESIGTSLQFTAAVFILQIPAIALIFPLFKNNLRLAFAELSDKSILLLCVTPILFYVIIMSLGIIMRYEGVSEMVSGFIGILVMFAGVISYYINVRMSLSAAKAAKTDKELAAKEQLYSLQRDQYKQLAQNAETIKTMQHNIRHQLSAIKGYAVSDESGKLIAYLDELIGGMPSADDKMYCDNFSVNSIVSHFVNLAKNEGIDIDVQLDIPENVGSVPVTDLCIIIGNLLENALEACQRMKHGKKHITLRSRIEVNTLSIGVSNSFDGLWKEKDGLYLSRKDEKAAREGIGISSVLAICKKHEGQMKIEAEKDTWKSSVLVYIAT